MAGEEEDTQEEDNTREDEQAQAVAMALEPVARWRVSAESDGPQGADGVAELARTAFANMLAADWEYDDAPASMPVHDYDRARPSGQAYKAVWGYDAGARTERSCCGAACYTYRIPDDALDGDNPGGVAAVSSVSVELAADRYCDAGAQVFAVMSDDIRPARFGLVSADAASAPVWLATRGQTGDDGLPLAPNIRTGVRGGATFAFDAPAAPGRYLHVFLVLADYTGTRGAWIEGGAMFASEAAVVGFSRAVAAGGDARPIATPLVLGRMDYGSGGTTPAAAMARTPRLQCWINWSFQATRGVAGKLADTSWDTVAQNILAFIYNSPELYTASPSVLDGSSVAVAATGRAAMVFGDSSMGVGFCAYCAHGTTNRRVYRGLRLGLPLNPAGGASSIPYRVMVFGIRDLVCFASSPRSATPLPWWGDIVSEAARRGQLESLRCLSDPVSAAAGSNINITQQQADNCTAVAVEPLAAVDATGETGAIEFARPWASGELSSVIVAVVPNGVPAASDLGQTYNATFLRTVAVTPPNSGASAVTRANISSSATISAAPDSWQYTIVADTSPYATVVKDGYDGTIAGEGEGSLRWLFTHGVLPAVTLTTSGSNRAYTWDDISNRKKTLATSVAFTLKGVTTVDGTTYNFNEIWLQTLNVTWTFDNASHIPGLISGSEEARLMGSYSTFHRTATGVPANGPTRQFTVEIPANWLLAYGNGIVQASRVFDATFSDTDYIGAMQESPLSATYVSGLAYSWANAAGGSVACPQTVSGSVSFERDGVTYTARLEDVAQQGATVAISGKGAPTTASGNDKTARATVSGTVPAISQFLQFTGANGLKLWASVSAPSMQYSSTSPGWGGTRYITAKSVYAGSGQTVAQRTAHDGNQTAAVRETGAEQTIDLGLLSLYE